MKKTEILKQSAKMDDNIINYLSQLSEDKKTILQFKNIEDRDTFQHIVKEGYAEKEYRSYKITKKGNCLLEGYKLYKNDNKSYNQLIKQGQKNTISIKYKIHEEKENIIKNKIAVFDINPQDNIPIISMNEEVYANLIHREKGQHWKKYLGESGRQLIRQKKISKFYALDESTNRVYLYIIP